MTYKYNPFWQQRIRETVRHALNVHPRLTALRVDLRLPDVPAFRHYRPVSSEGDSYLSGLSIPLDSITDWRNT
ncbi:hypothetical protein GUB07_25435 [Escherichia coli]|nr:hypothetical protein [Escherichia coli]